MFKIRIKQKKENFTNNRINSLMNEVKLELFKVILINVVLDSIMVFFISYFFASFFYAPFKYIIGIPMKIETDDIKCIKETALTIRGSRRRTTVPAEFIQIFDLEDGDKIRWIVLKDGTTYIQNVKKKDF